MVNQQEGCIMTCLGTFRFRLSHHTRYIICTVLLVFLTCVIYVYHEKPSTTLEDGNRKQLYSKKNCHTDTMATHDKIDGKNLSKSQYHERFDLQTVHDAFRDSLQKGGNISMDLYLKAYKELLRFINLLGKVFHFVSSDVEDKIQIMEMHRRSESGDNYANITFMLEYEISKDITVVKGHPPSGARTLLRLHRALLFLSEFMKHLAEMSPEDKLPAVLYQVYSDTLAPYHSWFVRKAFGVAVYAVPNRQHLLDKLGKEECDEAGLLALLRQIPGVIQPVYDSTQRLYEEHHLLELP